jgi:hypothetical protein
MRPALIETGHCNVDLKPSPIEPSWILEGNPEACSHALSTSACRTAKTLIWSCTAGKFKWYYDLDETIMILEGSIVLESEGMPPKRYGVGDVIFFREGAHAKWHVEDYVKKVAFLRQSNPLGIGFAIRALNKLKRIFFVPAERRAASFAEAAYPTASTPSGAHRPLNGSLAQDSRGKRRASMPD